MGVLLLLLLPLRPSAASEPRPLERPARRGPGTPRRPLTEKAAGALARSLLAPTTAQRHAGPPLRRRPRSSKSATQQQQQAPPSTAPAPAPAP